MNFAYRTVADGLQVLRTTYINHSAVRRRVWVHGTGLPAGTRC